MERNNWQKRTLVIGFIAIESLLLVISIAQPAFSSYFASSRQYRKNIKQIQLSGQFQARNYNKKVLAPEIESFKQETRTRHTSSNFFGDVDSLITMLVLGLILVRVNQQIQNKSQFNRELQELNFSKTQSSEN